MIDNFSIELAKQLVESYEQFSVDFDLLWQWCGYSRKQKAKDMLIKNFEKHFDFEITQSGELRPQGGYSNREIIKLTTDCAKEFGMLAQTENGKLVRKYFIAAEKELREYKQQQKQLSPIDMCFQLAQSVMYSAQSIKDLDRRVTVIEQYREEAIEKLENSHVLLNQLPHLPSAIKSMKLFALSLNAITFLTANFIPKLTKNYTTEKNTIVRLELKTLDDR